MKYINLIIEIGRFLGYARSLYVTGKKIVVIAGEISGDILDMDVGLDI